MLEAVKGYNASTLAILIKLICDGIFCKTYGKKLLFEKLKNLPRNLF